MDKKWTKKNSKAIVKWSDFIRLLDKPIAQMTYFYPSRCATKVASTAILSTTFVIRKKL